MKSSCSEPVDFGLFSNPWRRADRALLVAGAYSQGKLPDVQFGFALFSARLLEIDEQTPLDIQNRHVIAELLLL